MHQAAPPVGVPLVMSCPLKLVHGLLCVSGIYLLARKRYSDEGCLGILRQVEAVLAGEVDVAHARRSGGVCRVYGEQAMPTPSL